MSRSRRFFPKRWSQSVKFWMVVITLCGAAALMAVWVKGMLVSVGSARHTRYEPVDVPPADVSPRHSREREELERRERAVQSKNQ